VEIAFDQLIQLQRVDAERQAISSLLDAIPAKIETIDQAIKSASDIVGQAKDKLTTNQKKRRDLEGEIKTIKEHLAKFKRQLNDVKTNKEYTALLKEIGEAQHKADKIEEDILNEMIFADDIEKEIKTANARKTEEERRLQKEKGAILAERAQMDERLAALSREREALRPQIPPDQLRLYDRVAHKMKGVAMSPVTDDFCSLCQLRIRPQMLNDIMEMNKVITCEACSRILYYKKSADKDVPEEKLDNPDKVDESSAR
jgi:uncharacterized protein